MKINSELPLCLLDKNKDLNEFDFVLFHLYKECESYANYFKQMRKDYSDRLMILDNSAYEYYVKGEELDLNEFIACINALEPDYFVLPDVLMDKNKTIDYIKNFKQLAGDKILNSKPIAVAQGISTSELLDCLNEYEEMGIENIAIPFHNKFFKEIGLYCDEDIQNEFADTYRCPVTEDMLYAMGRVQFVRNYGDVLKRFKYIHFLGSHCPLEKVYYKYFDSMDTGYPVKCAYFGDLLGEEKSKPNIIIDDFFYADFDIEVKELMEINVERFKNI